MIDSFRSGAGVCKDSDSTAAFSTSFRPQPHPKPVIFQHTNAGFVIFGILFWSFRYPTYKWTTWPLPIVMEILGAFPLSPSFEYSRIGIKITFIT
jgi:hypothetical protein